MSNETKPQTISESRENQHDVIVIGAGFGGMYALHRLRAKGYRVRVLEAADGVGGTWYWNRYPGARCDVESMEYSYSFDNSLQQEWNWPERFSAQSDIEKYANHVADRFDLRKDIQFSTRIESAEFDKEQARWTIRSKEGETFTAQFLVLAVGNLSLPRVPDFKGLEQFKGRWFHTGQWPKEKIDFTGRTVGVVGTGSSGIQLIPVVAKQAKHLYVFQRTANYSVPSINRPLTPEVATLHKQRYQHWREEARKTPFGIAGHAPPEKFAAEDSLDERRRLFEQKWHTGGNISFLYAYKDLLINENANAMACEFVHDKILATVKDPKVAELLIPNDHPIGTKRLCLDTDYYETYNRDNVTLVNVRKSPIQELTANGLRTADQEYPLDDLIFATGYDAMTGAILDINISVKGGAALRAAWKDGPKTYLGVMVNGFPNMAIITGPGSPSVKTNMISAIEQHVDWITDLVAHLGSKGKAIFQANPDAQEKWVQHVNEVADSTLYPKANSWYVGANIPGKPRVFMPYVAGLDKYRKICDDVAVEGYRGIQID
jgi:cyclohexanone monooxygenase